MAARSRAVPAALLLAVALVAASCSGSDGGSGGATTTTTAATGSTDDGGGATTTTEPGPRTDVERAADAYVAGYPLVVSTRTFQRLAGLFGVNHLLWQGSLAGPDSRVIVAPNRDTLYSVAVLDLRSEPMVLTLPAVADRYYTYQLLDAWTESFAYLGTRATGGRAGTWVITPPGWEGEVPQGTEQIEATTPQILLLGRYLVADEADIANVTAISRKATLEPLSSYAGTEPGPALPAMGEPAGTAQDIPTDATFFDELDAALAVNPPTRPAQQELFRDVADLGIVAGSAATAGATPDQVATLDEGAEAGDAQISAAVDDRSGTDGGWRTGLDVGTYGDDLLRRAVIARVGWGANVPEEAVYPVARVDADGEPLDGNETYRIRFPADGLPPVDAFWSLSAYGQDLFFAENPSGRYTIGDRTPGLVHGDDGSLEITVSNAEPPPGPDGRRPNWLPVPKGPFVLMLRLYLPEQAVLDGDYAYPPIERVTGAR